MRHRLIVFALIVFAVSVLTSGLPAHAERLYWSGVFGDAYFDTWVASVRTDGSGLVEVYEPPGHSIIIGNVAVDPGSRRLYWTEDNTYEGEFALVRGDAYGCQRLVIGASPGGLELDLTGGKVYWTEVVDYAPTYGRIKRANLDFSSVETVLEEQLVEHLQLDLPRGKIYWYRRYEDAVVRANLDGSNVETAFTIDDLSAMQIDPVGQKLYMYQGDPPRFRRVDLDGSNPEDLAPQVGRTFVVDPSAGVVYWKSGGGMIEPPVIRRANLDGSNEVVVLEDHLAEARDLELDPSDALIVPGCSDVPALGHWGGAVLALLILAIGTPILLRRSHG